MTSAERVALGTASVSAYGTATNPQAAAAIATLTTPAAGVYELVGEVVLSGTIGAGDLNNFEVRKGATPVKTVVVAPTTGARGEFRIRVALDGATNVTVNATANASGASAVYNASVTATRVA